MTTNPWVTAAPEHREDGSPREGLSRAKVHRPRVPKSDKSVKDAYIGPFVTKVTGPQSDVYPPQQGLGVVVPAIPADLWVVGAHGGAGESTMAALVEGWAETDHRWPDAPAAACVLTARTHARGLLRAQAALQQWASRGCPPVTLHGLILISDAPGPLPKPLRDLAAHVRGGSPRTWTIPWIPELRCDEVPHRRPRALNHVLNQVIDLVHEDRKKGTHS